MQTPALARTSVTLPTTTSPVSAAYLRRKRQCAALTALKAAYRALDGCTITSLLVRSTAPTSVACSRQFTSSVP